MKAFRTQIATQDGLHQFKVVIYDDKRDENDQPMWISVALERQMIAHGPTAESAHGALRQVAEHRAKFDLGQGQKPFHALPKAEQVYWDLYNSDTCQEM